MRRVLHCVLATSLVVVSACAGVKAVGTETPTGSAGGSESAGRSGLAGQGGGGEAGSSNCAALGSCPPSCGDGKLDRASGEMCDDGNVRSGDGCSADCGTIEKDYACPQPGKFCTYLVKCGDGALGGIEQCDPPNVGNGCSAGCRIEPGFVCEAPPVPASPSSPATCHKTVCGDGTKEGAEACDDHNAVDGDGCSSSCTLEPDCGTGTCLTKCGDNIKLAPEACDDGNTTDGDGCSHDCKIEVGVSCTDTAAPPPAQLNLAVTYRDMISLPVAGATRHPDFESFLGSGTPNLVKPMLDAAGKPIMDGRCSAPGRVTAACPSGQQLTTAANFDQWYRDTPGVNLNIPGTLLLARQGNGSYLFDSSASVGGGFFPIDNKGWTVAPAKELAQGGGHDFGFTTEIRYFFQYRGGELLDFSGDDDVWIFVNRTLALDIGGLHPPTTRTLNVDLNAAALGLAVGGLYQIALFHAERHSPGSNFKLTLTGFAPISSNCLSACGDGVRSSAEECDDGNKVDGDGCSGACKIEYIIP